MKTQSIDPMKGVHKPDELEKQIRRCVDGNGYAVGYLLGSLKVLERKPPNPFIVPLLKRALERSK